MRVYTVDLYEYFKVKKPENGDCRFTCYIPDNSEAINPERKHPSMLVLPGGGYTHTSFREGEPIALKFVAKGFCAFVLNYSVKPVEFPYPLAEAIMAMNYIRLNADVLLTDKDMVAAVGFSAGGHLCGMLGSYYDSEEAKTIFKPQVSARPNAIVLGYPVISYADGGIERCFVALCGEDKEKLYKKLSIEKLINKESSPAFMWATYEDAVVPVRNSLIVASAYEAAGVPFALHIYGKGRHGLSASDNTVYGKKHGEIIKTKSIPGWIDLAAEWLEEQGIIIKD